MGEYVNNELDNMVSSNNYYYNSATAAADYDDDDFGFDSSSDNDDALGDNHDDDSSTFQHHYFDQVLTQSPSYLLTCCLCFIYINLVLEILIYYCFDWYLQSKAKTDTSAMEARNGKDIQGIPWERLQFTRDTYRQTRLAQYRNYQTLSLPPGDLEKVVSKTSSFLFRTYLSTLCIFFWI